MSDMACDKFNKQVLRISYVLLSLTMKSKSAAVQAFELSRWTFTSTYFNDTRIQELDDETLHKILMVKTMASCRISLK